MAEPEVLIDCDVLVGGYDFTTQHNEVTVTTGREMKDKSVFRKKTRIYKPGLKTLAFTARFFYEAGENPPRIDDRFFSAIDDAGIPMSVWPRGGDEGNLGICWSLVKEAYSFGTPHGDLLSGEASGGTGADILHPTSLKDHLTAVGASGNGSGFQLGSLSATQRAIPFIHVVDAQGDSPTLDVTIESDEADDFLSAATRFTFSQFTERGSQVLPQLDGPITDDWWRAVWTVGGTSPSFKFLVGLYIGPK